MRNLYSNSTKLLITLLSLIVFSSGKSLANKNTVTIGSKAFSESIIISELLAIMLEKNHGFEVVRKHGLGGTQVAFEALKNGEIDVYPEYTGTGYVMLLGLSEKSTPEKIHEVVTEEFKNRFQLIWSKPLGFNNTYALAVKDNHAKLGDISKISELKNFEKTIKYASPHEYFERADGHPAFVKHYSLNFPDSNVSAMEAGLMYKALANDLVDVGIVYSTDGRIDANNLTVLEDDLDFFPPYDAAFLTRKKALDKFPQLRESIEKLESSISESEMRKMNDQVDRLKLEAIDVAKNFLIDKGFIEGQKEELKTATGFFDYAIQRKAYLGKVFAEHIYLSTVALILALCLSIPLGIFMTRSKKASQYIFPVLNTIQTIPSLALLGVLIPVIGIGIFPAILALFLYALLPLVRNTYTGIKGIDPDLVEASKGIGLTDFQILRHVELPIALPVIIAGVRTAAVIVIGTATLAALIGAGGLGDPVFRGISRLIIQIYYSWALYLRLF